MEPPSLRAAVVQEQLQRLNQEVDKLNADIKEAEAEYRRATLEDKAFYEKKHDRLVTKEQELLQQRRRLQELLAGPTGTLLQGDIVYRLDRLQESMEGLQGSVDQRFSAVALRMQRMEDAQGSPRRSGTRSGSAAAQHGSEVGSDDVNAIHHRDDTADRRGSMDISSGDGAS